MNYNPSKFAPTDLKPGEFQMFCNECGWKLEKNAVCAGSTACPECHDNTGLWIAKERQNEPS